MAFYTEHKNYTNTSLSSLAMSVDALEEKLGMDFFVNLPDNVETAAETNISWTEFQSF